MYLSATKMHGHTSSNESVPNPLNLMLCARGCPTAAYTILSLLRLSSSIRYTCHHLYYWRGFCKIHMSCRHNFKIYNKKSDIGTSKPEHIFKNFKKKRVENSTSRKFNQKSSTKNVIYEILEFVQ